MVDAARRYKERDSQHGGQRHAPPQSGAPNEWSAAPLGDRMVTQSGMGPRPKGRVRRRIWQRPHQVPQDADLLEVFLASAADLKVRPDEALLSARECAV